MIDAEMAEDGLAISAVSWAELKHGTEKSQNKEKNWELCLNVVHDFDIEILPIDKLVGEKCGVLKNNFEKLGQKIEDFDLLIASTAIINGLSLMTENIKHFQNIESLKMVI